jgi:hypothetical protein
MPRKAGDVCGRHGCTGLLEDHQLPYRLDPNPIRILKCRTCGHVLLIVYEPGKPFLDLWLIDWDSEESFREFLDREYERLRR